MFPSEKRLEEAFPGKGRELRELMDKKRKTYDYKSVQEWCKGCYHEPKFHERLMCAINEILGGHGVEAMFRQGMTHPDMEYINMGDTYTTTLIFDYTSNTFKIQSMGDWVETAERYGRRFG